MHGLDQDRPSSGTALASCALLLLAVLSGCTSHKAHTGIALPSPPEPARPLYSLGSMLPFEARSADGTVLRGHLYLPNGTGPFAAILEYSPYWNTSGGAGKSDDQAVEVDGRTTLKGRLGKFLDAGFAVAAVNPRGMGVSDGCFDWGGKLDSQDLHAVVDALGTAGWSNGNVGMIGLSFPGFMQYVALRDPSPHLKALSPVSGIIDLFTVGDRNGPVTNDASAGPVLVAGDGTGAMYPITKASRIEPGETRPGHFCPGLAQEIAEVAAEAATGDRTSEWWAERDYRPFIRQSRIPMLVTNGITNDDGHVRQVEGLWQLFHGDIRMMLGPWGHNYPGYEDPEYAGPDYFAAAVAWMDHYLRNGPPVETGVVDYEDDAGHWRRTTAWPPPASTNATLYLGGSGLSLQPVAGDQTFQSTDTDGLPASCPNTAVYLSPPLAEDVLVAGYLDANLTLTSNMPDGNLGVFLHQVDGPLPPCPTGDVVEAVGLSRAVTDLRHRGHLPVGQDFPVATPSPVDVRSLAMASTVKAGSRLAIAVSGGSIQVVPDPMDPSLTIHGGGLSSITLPIVEGNLRFAEG